MTLHFWVIFGEQVALMLCSLILSGAIGVERQVRHKSAGFRTHVLVGVGACLFTLVSVYGFTPAQEFTRWDGSRIASQVVSGIGFLGAGVIFLSRNSIRGLTTAASIWMSAAVGMACGARLPHLAVVAVFIHFLTVFTGSRLSDKLPNLARRPPIIITYKSGKGILRDILERFDEENLYLTGTSTTSEGKGIVKFEANYSGTIASSKQLLRHLSELSGVLSVVEDTDD